jgi:hypothetical protein
MKAKEFLSKALGGNMNLETLKPLAIEEIMEQYAKHISTQAEKAQASGLSELLAAYRFVFERQLKWNNELVAALPMPAPVRKVLNLAVKGGELGHIKKDGRKPEAYYHKSFEYLVSGERNSHERRMLNACAGVLR